MKLEIILCIFTTVLASSCTSTRTHTSPSTWNSIENGMDRQEIARRIGRPAATADYSDLWRTQNWELRVEYDQAGHATNVLRQLNLEH